LDVGPGAGVFGLNLNPYFYINAIEIFEMYYYQYKLIEKYNQVFIKDVRSFKDYEPYNLAIVGDVFEHMTYEASRIVIDIMKKHLSEIVISLPYKSPQGPHRGNTNEEHIQDDLTRELVAERYPEFKKIYENMEIGHNGLSVLVWNKD